MMRLPLLFFLTLLLHTGICQLIILKKHGLSFLRNALKTGQEQDDPDEDQEPDEQHAQSEHRREHLHHLVLIHAIPREEGKTEFVCK